MSHFHKIPAYLTELALGSIASASRAIGIERSTHYSWLVRSRQGDESLQSIEWLGVTAPFHVHVESHVPAVAISAIESAAFDRAQNGVYVPSVHQGAPVFLLDESIVAFFGAGSDPDPEEIFLQFGQKDLYLRDDEGNRVQAKTYLKPDTGLTTFMLASWKRKKYGAHVSVESKSETVLRLERPDEKPMKTINASPVGFDDESDSVATGGKLALGRPAASSEEFDRWNAAGEFAPAPVTFVDQEGNRTEMVSAPDPLTINDLVKLKQQTQEARAASASAPATPPHVEVFGRDREGDVEVHDAPTQPAQQPSPAVEPERRMKLV